MTTRLTDNFIDFWMLSREEPISQWFSHEIWMEDAREICQQLYFEWNDEAM